MPRLSAEPEIVKFARFDAVQYEHDWSPENYDPYRAKQAMEDHLDEAVEAERLGWDGYFVTEHHFDAYTLAPQPNLFLAAVAARTSKMRLGQGVQILPVHNPVWLAEQYGMLDVLSGGRLEVGVGRGNFEVEWDRYAEDHADAPALFDENLELLDRALTQTGFTIDNPKYGASEATTVYPRPIQDPLPRWIAAVSPGSVERVARLGHNLAAPAIPDNCERLERFVEIAEKHGHDLSGANYVITLPVVCAPTDHEAEAIRERAKKLVVASLEARGLGTDNPQAKAMVAGLSNPLAGSPATVRDQLAELLQTTGARRMMLVIRNRGLHGEVSRQTQKLLAEDVFPQLRHLSTPGSVVTTDARSDAALLGDPRPTSNV